MKNNFKLRLAALLLCLVMLFSASCAAADPTPTSSQPTTATTKGTTPKPTEPEADEPEADGPTTPENGAEKIIEKTVTLYQKVDEFEDVTVAFYEGCPEILLVDTKTMRENFITAFPGRDISYTYEETDTTLTIKRPNGTYCIIDFVEDTMYFNNFDLFITPGYGNMADLLASTYVDSEGNSIYFKRTESLEIAGLPLRIDLAARDIPLDIYEGKKYVPLQTFNDVFLSPFFYNCLYNTEDLFITVAGELDSSLTDMYYSIEATERSEALATYSAKELCLLLDLYYGLKNEHGVSYGFETFIRHTGLWDDLASTDAAKSSAALASLTYGYLADKHSSFAMSSPYSGSSEVDNSNVLYHTSYNHFVDYIAMLKSIRADVVQGELPGYQEVGDTAYITFDAFTYDDVRIAPYSEASYTQDDTMGLIIYAHSQITRENSPIKNVVLDLSCNTGGAVDAAIYVVAWMLGYCDLHLTNTITGSYATASYKVDVNLDGEFDEKDTVADKNLYCVISPISFSCGNLVPSLLKESGKVTLIGDTSGGGACTVQFGSTADGSVFRFSSSHHLTVVSNGAYYTVDRGVEPHYYIDKFESYFDRNAFTEFINNMK